MPHHPAAARPLVAAPTVGADGKPLPGLRNLALVGVLALAAVLLAVAWYRERGPQLADSIEYMERAHALLRGEKPIDSQAIRAFGFSALLLPIFAVASWLDVRDFTHTMQACQVLQIALSLCLVAIAARLTARVAGRSAGIAAALLVAVSPILLRWGMEPVSGVAAGLFVALGLAKLFDRRTFASGFGAGAWFGLGILMAYQTISVVGTIGLFVLVRDWRSARRHTLGVASGVLALVLVQCTADLLYYGSFGVSVTTYLYQNFGILVATTVVKVATAVNSRTLYDLSSWLYNKAVLLEKLDPSIQANAAQYQEQVKQADAIVRQSHGVGWYLTNISKGVPWAALALVATGALRAIWLRSWKAWLAALVVVANVAAYGLKGSKDFRLWLPFLAAIALLGGLGWSTLASAGRRSLIARFAMVAGACALLVGAAVSGWRETANTNTRKYGGYWDAIEYVNARTAAEYASKPIPEGATEAPRDTVSCAWHWAVFLRSAPAVDLIKLPHHLDYWRNYTREERQEDLDAISRLDWFITHLPVLTDFHEVMEVVNREFTIEAVFFDRAQIGRAHV
jgi:hypothetical protein